MAKGLKTGGRKKGVPNKKTLDFLEILQENFNNFNPVIELINISKDKKTPLETKVSILKDLSSYLYPKRKACDINANIDTTKPIIVQSMMDKELLESI